MSDTTAPNEGSHNDHEGEEKVGGLGHDGTIPPADDGVAAGMGDEDSHFNSEEDPEAD